MPQPPDSIRIEVAYALPERAVVKSVQLDAAATIEDALRVAAADPDFAGIDWGTTVVGIFGKVAPPAQVLKDGDRVELYRPLAADPKLARRARAKEARRKR